MIIAWKRRLKRCYSAERRDRRVKNREREWSSNLNGIAIQQEWQCDPFGTAARFKLDGDTIQVEWWRLEGKEEAFFNRDISKWLIHSNLPTQLKNRVFAGRDSSISKKSILGGGCQKNILTFLVFRFHAPWWSWRWEVVACLKNLLVFIADSKDFA